MRRAKYKAREVCPGHTPVQPFTKLQARGLNRTAKYKPKGGSTRWSRSKLAQELRNVAFPVVHRIWRKQDPQPQRLDDQLLSKVPDSEVKAAGVMGL
jgi:hypothetical protein